MDCYIASSCNLKPDINIIPLVLIGTPIMLHQARALDTATRKAAKDVKLTCITRPVGCRST